MSLTLPVPAPTGLSLEKLILRNAPIAWLQTLEDVDNPNVDTSLSELQNLVGVSNVKSLKEVQQLIDPGMNVALTDEDITALIESLKTN